MAFIQTDSFTLCGYECDAFGRMSIPALMNMMQESANRNVIQYGIGIADLAQQGFGWMLLRFRLRMHQYPHYGETIRVTTYPTAVERFFVYRDFQVVNESGTLLADASSTWLVFSMEKRAMVPVPEFIRTLTPPVGPEPLPKLSPKPIFQMAAFVAPREKNVEVGWFTIDQNQHVNNVAYVQWLLEALDEEILKTRELAEIDLAYRAESHWQDSLTVQTKGEEPDAFLHRIIHAESGKEMILARSRWKMSL